jgi:hypothetical protein
MLYRSKGVAREKKGRSIDQANTFVDGRKKSAYKSEIVSKL